MMRVSKSSYVAVRMQRISFTMVLHREKPPYRRLEATDSPVTQNGLRLLFVSFTILINL